MYQDQNKKTLRQFQCRDYLWDIFEQMSGELECSVDYLINEAMRQYARSRNYGQRGPSRQPAVAPRPPATGVPPQQPGYGAPPVQPNAYAPQPGAGAYGAAASPSASPTGAPGYPPAGGGYPPAQSPAQRPSSFPPPPTQQPPVAPPGYGAPAPGGFGQGQAPQGPPLQGQPPQPVRPQAPPPLPSSPSAGPAPGGAGRSLIYIVFNGQKIAINKDEFIIGRGSKTADLPIKDGNISRRHAAVIWQSGGWFVKDLGSTNGVEFQGRKVDGKRIEEGDVFHLCDYELRFTYR